MFNKMLNHKHLCTIVIILWISMIKLTPVYLILF